MKNLLLFTVFLLCTVHLFAQTELDSIFTTKGLIIAGHVQEIGPTEVRYTQPQLNLDVVYVINTNEIQRIEFSGGQVQYFETVPQKPESIQSNSEELFQIQRKNAWKADFLSIAANTFVVTYERSLSPGRSMEFSGGIIGIGSALEEEDASGVLLRGGYKFARDPDFYISEMRYSHILKGSYLKLEIDFASYSVTGSRTIFDSDKERYNNTKWAFLVVLGKQWVFDDLFLIDVYSGMGLGNNSMEYLDTTYPYGFATLGENFPLAFSLGLRMGFLL